MVKTLNKVTLIGNIVKKPDLRKTSSGTSVCTFHLITDREWKVGNEVKKEAVRHICVAWDKLAEICHNLLDTGMLVFVEGRIENHKYTDPKGEQREQSEIVIQEMMKLSKGSENNDK